MQRRILQSSRARTLLLLVLASVTALSGYSAKAQTSTRRVRQPAPTGAPTLVAPSRASQPSSSVGSLDPHIAQWIEKGLELETASRWVEAAGHYEEAVREFPDNPKLRDRWNLARAHCDVARRHGDAEYVRWARSISNQEAIAAYGEILQKIHNNYVGAPSYSDIVREGVRFLLVAPEESVFLKSQGVRASTQVLQAFRKELQARAANFDPQTREEAKACAQEAARIAYERLGVPMQVAILEFAAASSGTLDEYSAFLSPSQLDELFSQIEGNFVGLGVEIKTEDDALRIVDVIPGSPAEKIGLRRNDLIVGVDGHHTRDEHPDIVAEYLRGPEGSQVEVIIRQRNGQEKAFLAVRQRVEVPCIDRVQMLDSDTGVAYLRLTNFQKSTSRDLDAALWKLHREGMRSLIIDLRGNPGGLLDAAVKTADKFIRDGKIVSTRGRSPREDFDYHAIPEGTWPVPLVVLIDGDSASASEIFAGAIRDHHRGSIVGSRSYGKGSVQGIFPLSSSSAGVRLTTSRFYSPSGQAISGKGVEPHIRVEVVARPNPDGEIPALTDDEGNPIDMVLERGLEEARTLAQRRQSTLTRASK